MVFIVSVVNFNDSGILEVRYAHVYLTFNQYVLLYLIYQVDI